MGSAASLNDKCSKARNDSLTLDISEDVTVRLRRQVRRSITTIPEEAIFAMPQPQVTPNILYGIDETCLMGVALLAVHEKPS